MDLGFPPALAARRHDRFGLGQGCDGAVAITGSLQNLRHQRHKIWNPEHPSADRARPETGTGRGHRLFDLAEPQQSAAAQNIRVPEQRKALVGRPCRRILCALQSDLRLSAEQAEDRLVEQRVFQSERVPQSFGQMRAVAGAASQPPCGIAEQPLDQRPPTGARKRRDRVRHRRRRAERCSSKS